VVKTESTANQDKVLLKEIVRLEDAKKKTERGPLKREKREALDAVLEKSSQGNEDENVVSAKGKKTPERREHAGRRDDLRAQGKRNVRKKGHKVLVEVRG